MKKNSKKGILILVLLLAIGFAAVTTTLVINGTITIGANSKNFNEKVVFDDDLDESDVTTTCGDGSSTCDLLDEDGVTVSDNGKTINFKATFKNIGDQIAINYTIENNSQYIANIQDMSCEIYDNSAKTQKSNQDYFTVTNKYADEASLAVNPESTLDGTLTAKMVKSFVGTDTYEGEDDETVPYYVTCTVAAKAGEYTKTTSSTQGN